MAIIGRAITPIMAKMGIMGVTGENGFEKDSSYGILWSKQKNGHFQDICKIDRILKLLALYQF